MNAPRPTVMRAVRAAVEQCDTHRGPVLVACSGGADSLALAAALGELVTRGRHSELRAGAVVVDHGLQDDSALVAARAGQQCVELGLDPVTVVAASVPTRRGKGPEAAARDARYAALVAQAKVHGAAAVFLGHTADDQAETVLLGLARGSGPRALAGMPVRRGIFHRPLLGVSRSVVRAAFPEVCPWHDPHNEDPRFARTRARHVVVPVLEEQLGPGVAAALARSAAQVRAEVDAVDAWSRELAKQHVRVAPGGGVRVDALALRDFPDAVVTRIMRDAALVAGSDASRISSVHLGALTALVTHWRGQGRVDLPGGVAAARESGTVVVGPASPGLVKSTPSVGPLAG